jgi:outer membrane lipoprotein carrier protein
VLNPRNGIRRDVYDGVTFFSADSKMKQTIWTIAAAAVLAGCGRGDSPPPSAGAPAAEAPGMPGVQPEDTLFEGADGMITGPGSGVAMPAPGGDRTPQAGAPGTAPAAGTGGAPVTGGTASPVTPPGGGEQPDQGGAATLRRAAAAYENVRSLQADFVMQLENPLLRQRLTSRGTLYQRQPDRIALRFSDPAGDLILGDGQFFYMYQPSNNPDQYFRQPAAAAGETGVNLMAQFVGNPVERFNFTAEGGESVAGRSAQVLNLVPRQRADYRSLRVWIDDRDSLVRRFEITEHNGAVRRFDLSNMQVNPSIPDAIFRFTPPAGARAVSPG